MASGLIGPAVADHDVGTGYQPPEDCQGPGFNTTPRLPNSPWQVHDPCRPHPPVVNPGEPTFPDPPEDATVLIGDGDNGQISLDDWNDSSSWDIKDGYVVVGDSSIVSKQGFGDGHYHVEWQSPESISGSNQVPGNSGFFLANRYEIQVLNNYQNPTYADGYAASVYGQHPPLVNASRPKGNWQTYDIIWRAPRFADNGDLESPGRVTVYWNDVLVQAQTVLNGPTVYKDVAEYSQHSVEQPIKLQNHGQPVRFRNVWYEPGPTPASVPEFTDSSLTVEHTSSTIDATITNPYDSEITDGDVALSSQSGSEVTVTPQTETSFGPLSSGASQSVSWKVTRPSEDSGPYLLNSSTTYSVDDGSKTVDFKVPVYPEPESDGSPPSVTLNRNQVASLSNGMKLDVAPDGRVFYTTRGRGFTNSEGGDPRYPPEPTGTAKIGVYHPDSGDTTIALEKEVHGGIEDGGQGIVFDPNFEENGWVYFFYSPSNHELADNQEELESLDTYKEAPGESLVDPYNVVSRFTVDGDTIDPTSETEIIRIPVQRERCCHVGGALAFDLEGNLLITTGDDTDPFESSAYTPIDERDGRRFFDAQRTSGNTNDLRGSLLRITPKDDGGYTVPDGNLFTGDEYADARANNKVKTEIYAMGFRNPFTLTVDEETGDPFIADYGPDAGSWDPQRGPPGLTEFVRVDEPGFYGWPYFTGMNVPYRDYDFATGETGDPFDPDNPVNDSPNNDGLTDLPPAQPATITNPYSWDELIDNVPEYADDNVPDEIPYPIEGTDPPTGGSPMIGEIYQYKDDFDPSIALPGYYDDKHIIMERRGWFKTVTYAEDGSVSRIDPFPTDGGTPMMLHTGQQGGLYLLKYGGLDYITTGEVDDGGPDLEPVSIPFGYDAGGETVDGTVTIDGIEFVAESPSVQVSNEGNSSPTGKPDLEIEGTENDELYQSEEWGENLSYEVGLEDGVYDVTLHFAEFAFDDPNGQQRVFNVSVEGEQVINELNLREEVGFATAYTKTVENVAVSDGSLSITMSDPVENSKLSGFEISEADVEEPTEGLVGQWQFGTDNVDGDTVIDATGNDHDGTIAGGVSTGIDTPDIPGDAAEFNGSDGTVVIPDADALDPAAYTISTWINTDNAGYYAATVGKNESMWAGFDSEGSHPRFDPDDDSSNGAFATDVGIADGEWHHLVYRHAPGENVSEIYIDGTPAVSSEGASESSSSTDDLAIASKSGTKDWLGGMLADVRLYNRALSQVEIYGLYQYDGSTGGSQPPAVVGDSKPTDPDGDGKYEDIDGDGETEYDDVVDFFDHFDDDSVQNNPDVYDFNDNDRLDFDDLVELFRSL